MSLSDLVYQEVVSLAIRLNDEKVWMSPPGHPGTGIAQAAGPLVARTEEGLNGGESQCGLPNLWWSYQQVGVRQLPRLDCPKQ
jgi:hypothetical protein